MFVFPKIWRALFSWNTSFEIQHSALLPTNYTVIFEQHRISAFGNFLEGYKIDVFLNKPFMIILRNQSVEEVCTLLILNFFNHWMWELSSIFKFLIHLPISITMFAFINSYSYEWKVCTLASQFYVFCLHVEGK